MFGMIIFTFTVIGLYALMHFLAARAVSQHDGSAYISDHSDW